MALDENSNQVPSPLRRNAYRDWMSMELQREKMLNEQDPESKHFEEWLSLQRDRDQLLREVFCAANWAKFESVLETLKNVILHTLTWTLCNHEQIEKLRNAMEYVLYMCDSVRKHSHEYVPNKCEESSENIKHSSEVLNIAMITSMLAKKQETEEQISLYKAEKSESCQHDRVESPKPVFPSSFKTLWNPYNFSKITESVEKSFIGSYKSIIMKKREKNLSPPEYFYSPHETHFPQFFVSNREETLRNSTRSSSRHVSDSLRGEFSSSLIFRLEKEMQCKGTSTPQNTVPYPAVEFPFSPIISNLDKKFMSSSGDFIEDTCIDQPEFESAEED